MMFMDRIPRRVLDGKLSSVRQVDLDENFSGKINPLKKINQKIVRDRVKNVAERITYNLNVYGIFRILPIYSSTVTDQNGKYPNNVNYYRYIK